VVAETVGHRLQPIGHLYVGERLGRVPAPRGEGNRDRRAGVGRRFLKRRAAAQHDEVRERNLGAATLPAVEVFEHALKRRYYGQGSPVDRPILLRRQRKPRPVRAAALIAVAVGGGGRKRRE